MPRIIAKAPMNRKHKGAADAAMWDGFYYLLRADIGI